MPPTTPLSYADPAVAAFVGIPLVLAAVLVWGVFLAWRRSGAPTERASRVALAVAVASAGWLAGTWLLASSGTLQRWERVPPPFVLLMAAVVTLAVALAMSPIGLRIARTLPLWALVAVQGFRLPLELAMHQMYERGVMPGQMSYSGRNFDIVTGTTALIVAALVASGRAGWTLVAAWNVLGLMLLLNVMTVAVLSTPQFRYFGDAHLNTWVAFVPFVWLPAVMVLAALAGHLVIFRAIAHRRRARSR